MQNTQSHYEDLFRSVIAEFGEFDQESITSIVGFSAGGPVSISRTENGNVYVTCELSLYPEQLVSSEGLRYEFLCRSGLTEEATRSLFTALGNLSMEATLGSRHTVDVGQVMAEHNIQLVRLNLFSRSTVQLGYGIYEVVVVGPSDA
jgi:hypothetical protein